MDDWGEGMEYLEEYGDAEAEAMEDAAAGAQGENDADAEINEALDHAEYDRIARENGEKPINEWTRRDFRHLIRYHAELRKLTTPELRALFLTPTRIVGDVLYCRRGNVQDVRKLRENAYLPMYRYAVPISRIYANWPADWDMKMPDAEEMKKLDKIWEKL